MARKRIRITHDGDIVGAPSRRGGSTTRVFVDTYEDREGHGDVCVMTTDITESVLEIRMHPMKVGELSRADVTLIARHFDAEAELAHVAVVNPRETRWRVGLNTEAGLVDLFVVLPSTDRERVEQVEAAARAAGLPLEPEPTA